MRERRRLFFLLSLGFPKNNNDQITGIVNTILNLNVQLQSTNLKTQHQKIQRSIAHAEKKIDELVYELYGPEVEETKIVEKGT